MNHNAVQINAVQINTVQINTVQYMELAKQADQCKPGCHLGADQTTLQCIMRCITDVICFNCENLECRADDMMND